MVLAAGPLSIRLDENFARAISEGVRRNDDIMLHGAYAGHCSGLLPSMASAAGFVCADGRDA
jgi:hypothetical protein